MSKDSINTELTREDIITGFSKGKKAKQVMRYCVTKDEIAKIKKIGHAIELLSQEESLSLGE